jgi:hypothetical protein
MERKDLAGGDNGILVGFFRFYGGFNNFVAALERSDNVVARNHAFASAQARLQ